MKSEKKVPSKKNQKKRPQGRPSKLNPETCQAICENIEMGLPYKFACESAGISYQTFLSWKAKADVISETKSPSKYTKFEESLIDFLDKVRKAEADGVKENIRKIKEIGDGDADNRPDWKARSWILKCRHPELFGDLQKIDQKTEHSGGVSIQLNMKDCSKKADE